MNARVIRNTPIFILLVISFSLHGIALFWPTPDSIAETSAVASNSGIHVRLNPHTPTNTSVGDKPESTVSPSPTRQQPRLAKIRQPTTPTMPVKSVPEDKALISETAKEIQPFSAPEKVNTVKHHSEGAVIKTASQTASADSDPQQLKIRIQQLIKLRVSHNQYYPRIARKRAWEGQVKLGMQVRSDGQLTDIHVVASSGHRVLDKAAMKSVRVVTHVPEARDWLQGRSIDVILPIIYKLTDS